MSRPSRKKTHCYDIHADQYQKILIYFYVEFINFLNYINTQQTN